MFLPTAFPRLLGQEGWIWDALWYVSQWKFAQSVRKQRGRAPAPALGRKNPEKAA